MTNAQIFSISRCGSDLTHGHLRYGSLRR